MTYLTAHQMPDAAEIDLLHPSLTHHLVNTLGWARLRPLQAAAIEPLLAGEDALLLAPTASGKTEAALLPILSRIAAGNWPGVSVLYLCPLKALLNNLLPRARTYAGWLGLRAECWHGDVAASTRAKLLREPPEILLTTPESVQAMLVSTTVDHARLLGGVRVVIVDEVHAFAGDDRGWHLLALLERLTRLTGGPPQRVGLSATVGNPAELLRWLQGSGAETRPARLVAPDQPARTGGVLPAVAAPPSGDVELDHVGSIANAATVIAALHRGEKRLVFCDSRRQVEELGQALRAKGVTTYLSHALLAAAERQRAEQAFVEARDCVIVATSTLELGVDVGDLDRVIQINAPLTVASFLQRLGRTGRRPGSSRNCLFLTLSHDSLLHAAGLLALWGRGWVEPVAPPATPRHIVAQQILALCLERPVGDHLWSQEWNDLAPFDASAAPILAYLRAEGFLESDGGMLFIGPRAERVFGRRHFMELTAVFTAPPEYTVLCGREEIGRVDATLLAQRIDGPRLLLLAGRSWRVTHTDWARRRAHVEPADSGGKARWGALAVIALSGALTQAMRDVLLGADPPVLLSRRARAALAELRSEHGATVYAGRSVIHRDDGGGLRWWTWAGTRANATLIASLPSLVEPDQRPACHHIRLAPHVTPAIWKAGVEAGRSRLALPTVDEDALAGLKFATALPRPLAAATLAARLADLPAAEAALRAPVRFLLG